MFNTNTNRDIFSEKLWIFGKFSFVLQDLVTLSVILALNLVRTVRITIIITLWFNAEQYHSSKSRWTSTLSLNSSSPLVQDDYSIDIQMNSCIAGSGQAGTSWECLHARDERIWHQSVSLWFLLATPSISICLVNRMLGWPCRGHSAVRRCETEAIMHRKTRLHFAAQITISFSLANGIFWPLSTEVAENAFKDSLCHEAVCDAGPSMLSTERDSIFSDTKQVFLLQQRRQQSIMDAMYGEWCLIRRTTFDISEKCCGRERRRRLGQKNEEELIAQPINETHPKVIVKVDRHSGASCVHGALLNFLNSTPALWLSV